MFQRSVDQVEVHSFHKQVGRYQHLLFRKFQYGRIVADAIFTFRVFQFDVLGEVFDQSEFAQGCNFSSIIFVHSFCYDLLISSFMMVVMRG